MSSSQKVGQRVAAIGGRGQYSSLPQPFSSPKVLPLFLAFAIGIGFILGSIHNEERHLRANAKIQVAAGVSSFEPVIALSDAVGKIQSAIATLEQVPVDQTVLVNDPVASCRRNLPAWVVSVKPDIFGSEFDLGSDYLSDKTQDKTKYGHKYQHMYHRYLAPMAGRTCEEGYSNKIRILEIGLGCGPAGGMIRGTPGGSALAWNHMFPSPQFDLDLHIMEFDANCATKWHSDHNDIANIHIGDANSTTDLDRVMEESGGTPFDFIIDDSSHINEHQINTFQHMIQNVAPGGFYTIEDIHSSCKSWKANTGAVKTGLQVQGTNGCMETKEGKPTIFAKLIEWQKPLLLGRSPFAGVSHIDICYEAAIISKHLK